MSLRPRLIVDITREVGVGHYWLARVRWLGRNWLVTKGLFPLVKRAPRVRRGQLRVVKGGLE